MKIKTSELSGPALDWAVAKCEEKHGRDNAATWLRDYLIGFSARYSAVWSQAGPIIEREFIELRNQTNFSGGWEAWKWVDEKGDYLIVGKRGAYCKTPLIAAMRCYVSSKLGDEVEVPEELSKG